MFWQWFFVIFFTILAFSCVCYILFISSDTIIQEKRSDMLEEYERVYDNETGSIYRAYNGFLDDIGDQSRYTPITDSQYTEGYDGWIDK